MPAQRTCQEQWPIGRNIERDSKESILSLCHDDDHIKIKKKFFSQIGIFLLYYFFFLLFLTPFNLRSLSKGKFF